MLCIASSTSASSCPVMTRIHIASLVAELPDAADDLQMECVFIDITLRRGQDNADRFGKCLYRFCLKIGYIASCAIMRRTRSLVSRLMEGLSLQVRDTVEGETPAAAATSLMVTAIVCSSLVFIVSIVKLFLCNVNAGIRGSFACSLHATNRFIYSISTKNLINNCEKSRKFVF